MGVRQREQALGKRRGPGYVGARQGQRQRERQRPGAAGGQIAQIHGERLVPELERVDRGEKVPALDQHVARDGELRAGCGLQQGAVVADAERRLARRALEETFDQVEFTHGIQSLMAGSVAASRVGQRKLRGA